MKARALSILVTSLFTLSGVSCVEIEPTTENAAELTNVTFSLGEADLTVTPYEMGQQWDIFNDSSTPELYFNVAAEPASLAEDVSITSHLHLYALTNDEPVFCYFEDGSGGYSMPGYQIEYLTEYSQPVILGRPLVMSLGQLPVGDYFWIQNFTLVDEDGVATHTPFATPPSSSCEIADYYDVIDGFHRYLNHLSIVPTYDEATYVELIDGFNDPDDASRFNVIFFLQNKYEGYEMTVEEMILAARHMVGGEEGGEFGLLSSEPYASNPDSFNFWVYEEPLPPHSELHDGANSAFSLARGGQSLDDLSLYQRMLASSPHDGLRTIPVWIQPTGNVGGKTCGWNQGAIIYFPNEIRQECLENGYADSHCMDVARADRVLTHEIAHIIGGADENYFDEGLFDPASFWEVTGYELSSHFSHWMTFYSPELDSDASCSVTDWGEMQCYDPNPEAIADCEANAQWRDLLGNGCGEPGVIDCDPSDPLYEYEVTCNNLGSGRTFYLASDLFKATQESMMDDRMSFLDINTSKQECQYGPSSADWTWCATDVDLEGRVFGEATERQLCVFLEEWTGEAAEGVCEQLCLETCADGQRCIDGYCMVPGAPGDINADGQVNLVDTQCIILANLATMSDSPMPACAVEPEMGDMDCSGGISHIDIQLSIRKVLACPNQNCNAPLNPVIDANQDGVHDGCNDVLLF